MHDVLAGDRDAAARLCRSYQSHILRVVRHRLARRMRARFDSLDFVHDVWASFFANPPRDLHFDHPGALIAYLGRIAQYKVGEEGRRQTGRAKDIRRERPLEHPGRGPDALPPSRQPTPSQIVGAEDEWERMLHGRSPLHQRILLLLRGGLSHREIADRLQTNEKTIRRLLRHVDPRASDA
jgi:RNA polymerase sigma-70 factor (ECF subfamily)